MGYTSSMDHRYVRQQVTRLTEDHLTEYAYRPEGTVDPLEEELLWLSEPEATATIPPGYEAYTMSVNGAGTRGKAGQGPWQTCYICRYDYPESQMVKHNGRFYCRPQRCNEDLL